MGKVNIICFTKLRRKCMGQLDNIIPGADGYEFDRILIGFLNTSYLILRVYMTAQLYDY